MKKINLILVILVSVAVLFSSCKKTEENLEPAADGTGSYSMTIDGNTFSNLKDELNMVLGVIAFGGVHENGVEFSVMITAVPSVGETISICNTDCPDEYHFSLIYIGDVNNAVNMMVAYDGTVKRTANKKVEINGNLIGMDDSMHPFSLTININRLL